MNSTKKTKNRTKSAVVSKTGNPSEPYQIDQDTAQALLQESLPYEIKEISFEQIARYAPFLAGREDLREKAADGRDVWDYVERKGLYPILRKNGGFAAVWTPSARMDGSFEWCAVYAVAMPKESIFFNFLQPTGFLRAALADVEQMFLFQLRQPSEIFPFQEVMINDHGIMPLISFSPIDRNFRLHISPKGFLAWLLTLPTMTFSEFELDRMVEAIDGNPPKISTLSTSFGGHWFRWNIGALTPQLGAQWIVASRSGGTQNILWWRRFIPEGFSSQSLIFDQGIGAHPRFIEKQPPKQEDVNAGISEIKALGSAKEQKARKTKTPKTPKTPKKERYPEAIEAEFSDKKKGGDNV